MDDTAVFMGLGTWAAFTKGAHTEAMVMGDTANGARTGFFVPERDSLFVAVPHRGTQAAEIRCYQIK
jgi:hypothetical protein